MTLPDMDTLLALYAGRKRDALLPVLWDVQTAFGFVSPEAVHAISRVLRVPEADIFGVIGFYSMFHDTPTGETIVRVCTDPACGLAGADAVLADAERQADGRPITVEHSACLGLCDHAPAALVSQRGHGEYAVSQANDFAGLLVGDQAMPPTTSGGDPLVLLAGVDSGEVETLARYGGDYAALRAAIAGHSQQAIIDLVKEAGLIGRGGAAFPTGIKWQGALDAGQARDTSPYVICNADESEPGTFKDRVLLEYRPHLVLEGVALCAYAIGAREGIIFVRGEYPDAERQIAAAIAEAEAAGLLGDGILGSEFSCHITIRRGAGAYICGEETALFEAIEGARGFPRIKPPYPTTHGLFGQPTAINNVETLSTVPGIVTHGAAWFRQWGTERSAGTKLVSVSGHVARPGVYEINPGITLRTLLVEYCGGVTGDLQALLMGGAAGTFLGPEDLDVRLTFEDLRAAGSTFGSGAVMVFNATADLHDVLRRLARFFHHESCGKCFPCQLGTQRQYEILAQAAPAPGDRERLNDIGLTMREASLCGLGQTAGSAVMSALERWPELCTPNGTGE